jgi:hypothetical protein
VLVYAINLGTRARFYPLVNKYFFIFIAILYIMMITALYFNVPTDADLEVREEL